MKTWLFKVPNVKVSSEAAPQPAVEQVTSTVPVPPGTAPRFTVNEVLVANGALQTPVDSDAVGPVVLLVMLMLPLTVGAHAVAVVKVNVTVPPAGPSCVVALTALMSQDCANACPQKLPSSNSVRIRKRVTCALAERRVCRIPTVLSVIAFPLKYRYKSPTEYSGRRAAAKGLA